MSRYYQELDRVGGFDYDLQEIPGLGLARYRGPPIDLDRPFLACVGAAQTFGRFVHDPFPSILGRRLGLPVLNLGVGGAGPRHFNRLRYRNVLNRAEAVVFQVLSGRSSSSSMFDNAWSGGLLGRSTTGEDLVRADDVFVQAIKEHGRGVVKRLIGEMRENYLKEFLSLIEKITAPRILFWWSTRAPDEGEAGDRPPGGVLGRFPHLIDRRIVSELASACEAHIECVSSAGLPQPLWPAEQSIDGAVSHEGRLENHYYPSPQMHIEAADALEDACRRFTGRARAPAPEAFTRFVIFGAERTGTNLLISLLNQFDGCLCLGELFNPVILAAGRVPGLTMLEDDRERLTRLRADDPAGFWSEICEEGRLRGLQAVGFKLFYSHALAHPTILDAVAADRSVAIIHVTRRNLLRRLVSERQAQAVKQWSVAAAATLEPRPAVTITPEDLWRSATTIEARQARFDALFAGHRVLRVIYEDLAARPSHVGALAAAFLGAPPRNEPAAIRYQKTGAEGLATVVGGFEELRARTRRWAGFFDT